MLKLKIRNAVFPTTSLATIFLPANQATDGELIVACKLKIGGFAD